MNLKSSLRGNHMDKVLVIVGQTAVGKTSMSIKLAKHLNGEIINGDAMQVYKGLNIVTDKIKKEQMQGVAHHLFDLKEIHEDYNVEEYQSNIRNVITKVSNQGKLPIIVGGTGLYVKAALYDYRFDKEEEKKSYKDLTNQELLEKIRNKDNSLDIHINNRKRLEREL